MKYNQGTTNDLQWIISDKDELEYYLSEVTTEQFITDIKALIAKSADKELIKQTISKLQELL